MKRTSLAESGTAALLLAIITAAVIVYVRGVSDDRYFADILLWILWSLVAVGVFKLVWAPVRWLRRDTSSTWPLRIFPEVTPIHFMPVMRHRRVPLMLGMPNIGLYGGWFLNILMFLFMVLNTPRPTVGIRIRLPRPYPATWQHSPQSETLGVYVAGHERIYVNSQLVPRDQLRARLQEGLSHRAVWTVYFEDDENCAFMDALYAMDAIQGAGGQVYWITPRVREELNRNASP